MGETGQQTMFQQLGGARAVRALVAGLFDRLLADADVARFFRGVDLAGLRERFAEFLCCQLGGPDGYRGPGVAAAHRNLGITDFHCDVVVGHLQATLEEAGATGAVRKAVVAAVAGLRSQVVQA